MAENLNFVCSACNSVVRVPGERLAEHPKCPRCHEALFRGQPIELRASNFEQFTTRNEVPVVVDFWASWCGPCQAMAPRFAAAAKEFEPRARLAKVCTEDEPGIATRFNVRSIPTMIAFHGGREVGRQIGALDSGTLARWIQGVILMRSIGRPATTIAR